MDKTYYRFLDLWEKECDELIARTRKHVEELTEKGEERVEIITRTEKLLSPYHYFFQRMEAREATDNFKFTIAATGEPVAESPPKSTTAPSRPNADDGLRPPLQLTWAPEGIALLKNNVFGFTLFNGQGFEIPMAAFKKSTKKDGEPFFSVNIQGTPTNLFRKGDDTSTTYTVHQAKMRDTK